MDGRPSPIRFPVALAVAMLALGMQVCAARRVEAQADQLNQVHIQPPPPKQPKSPAPVMGKKGLIAHSGEHYRVNVNLVLIPVTVTDPMGRLVIGLQKGNFRIYDNNQLQTITSFSTQDAPVSIGVIFDMSGSMSDKILRARDAILDFMKTSNPRDEFFVIGFSNRPQLIEDFTSSAAKVESRLAVVHAAHRTALIDAIYYGLELMRTAKYSRKALLVVSDGGENDSRYTENELRDMVRESDVQIYSLGIFDQYAPTIEEQMGPELLNEISNETGGRLFRVDDISEMSDIAARISAELRNEYVLGYNPTNPKHDGKWRKVRVKLIPPPGLPPLTVHARNGYYAPLD